MTASDDTTLTYEISNTRPIELLDLTSSLLSLGEQYRGFMRRQGEGLAEDDYRFYVREIRTGSIIVDLVSQALQPQIIGPAAPFLVQFTQEIGDWFEFFKGVKDAKDIKEMILGATKKDFQQVAQVIEPAAKDPGSRITSPPPMVASS